jgi:hypothetical protein
MPSKPPGCRSNHLGSLLAVGVAAIGVALALRGGSSIAYFIRDRHFGSYGGEFTRILIGEGLSALGYLVQAAGVFVVLWALVASPANRPTRIGRALIVIAISWLVLAGATVVLSWIYVQHRYLHTAGTGQLAGFLSALCLSAAAALAAAAFLRAGTGRNGRQRRDLLLARAAAVAAIGFALTVISIGLLAKAWGDASASIPDSYVASLWITAAAGVVITAGWIITARGFFAADDLRLRDHRLAIAAAIAAVGYLVDGTGGVIRQAGFDGSGWGRAAGWADAGHLFVIAFGLLLVAVAFYRARSVVTPR